MSTTFFVVTRREVKETVTDWRILLPMFTLALLFPGILVLGMNVGLPYLDQIDPRLAGEKAALFGATMAAFFPISFSLIVALESFAGEKERNTLEALLATPISDAQMFLGKFLAVLAPPVALSLLGLTVFTAGLRIFLNLAVAPDFLLLAMALGFVEALTMVAAAVVVSSQAPTVKAANLLASFIIIPVALVVQGEVMLLLAGYGQVLWLVFAAFIVIAAMLIRMGIQLFNREEILTRENDTLDFRSIGRSARRLWSQFPGESAAGVTRKAPSLDRLYLKDFPRLVASYRGPLLLVLAFLVVGSVIGYLEALEHPLNAHLPMLQSVPDAGVLSGATNSVSVTAIFFHNLQTIVIAGLFSLVTFGAAGLMVAVLTAGAVGFLAGQAGLAGADVPTMLLALIAPHGLFEVPAVLLASALNLWLGMSLMTLPKDRTLGEGIMLAGINWVKGAAVFVPLLLIAAIVEAKVTPIIALTIYGAG